jgi:hypothetical protein
MVMLSNVRLMFVSFLACLSQIVIHKNNRERHVQGRHSTGCVDNLKRRLWLTEDLAPIDKREKETGMRS